MDALLYKQDFNGLDLLSAAGKGIGKPVGRVMIGKKAFKIKEKLPDTVKNRLKDGGKDLGMNGGKLGVKHLIFW